MQGLAALLAEDAILVSDGGGKRKAALRVMVGRDDVVRLMQGLAWRGSGLAAVTEIRTARINGYPGLVVSFGDGPETIAFQPGEDGLIAAVYMVRNPEKLTHVSPQ
jgi:RNA polymerase sigma-70 factor (ECF subfamily)